MTVYRAIVSGGGTANELEKGVQRSCERARPKIDLECMRREPEIREVGRNRKGENRQAGRWGG